MPITLTYTNADGIKDVDGLPAPTFVDQPVTNNVEVILTAPDVTVPAQNYPCLLYTSDAGDE